MHELQRAAIVLHVLHHASEEPVHGAWMSEELARHGYSLSPGTLYPTLHRLERDGLLVSEQVVVEGRSRRVYRATPAGEAALQEGRRAVRELAGEVLPKDGRS
ncbi:helix-turn-helix transcriptional regulator [Nakamurella aerolata]|uniref:Helix-turn-helix transcriptional regulator n=1 Tax=Nakamurella aerolata TaxID=1656892 RepID=A0A849ADL4_9ACTN|nr:helix-turn-helix transcriptional regulator [Nakamurella aerolata]